MTAKEDKITDFEALFPSNGESARFLVGCRRSDYSASRIARAVEDCDAHLLNLNVTSLERPDAEVVVDLRVDRRNPSAVMRSLERYGYEVLEYDGWRTLDDDTARERYEELMHYLSI